MGLNKRFKAWTAGEDALLAKHYPAMGASVMLSRGYLADRTREAINRRAYVLGVKHVRHAEGIERIEMPWPMPTMNGPETQDCIRLRSWRYPVEAGALYWRIA